MKYLYNDRQLRDRRRELRKNMTDAEILLWSRLRMRRVMGYKFLRQYSVGPYIMDFFCVELKLGIEADGRFHGSTENAAYDMKRGDFLAEHGVELMRFWNEDVLYDVDSVAIQIKQKIALIANSPLEEGEKEGLSD